MKIDIETLSNIYSEHLWLTLSGDHLKKAEPDPRDYSNQTGCHQAYINRLCLNLLLKWMQENLETEISPNIFPNEKFFCKIWEFVNGCGINLGNKRLVLIPSDAIDMADFSVPQEWVDIPNWTADYYLPVRVDLEEKYLHFWGFVSRETLKAKADYDSIYRLYHLSGDWVIPHLEILAVKLELCPDEKGSVIALPKLSETEAEDLMEKLSKPSPYSPRLKAKFEKWGALLNESRWLQELYQRRVLPLGKICSLSEWLNGAVEAGWQTFEDWLKSKTVAPAFRLKKVRGIELETPEKINRAVKQLRNSQSEVILPQNMEDKNALVQLILHTSDETIRWKAAEYLWTIDPNYPNPAIRRVMDLGVQLKGNHIALMIAVLRKLDGQVAVLLRAYPMGNSLQSSGVYGSKLPPGLRLIGLYEDGNPIPGLEATAREKPLDNYISLNFSADVGDRFHVRLTLGNISITEQFIV